MGKKTLIDHFHREDWPFQVVGTGDTISLGARTVSYTHLTLPTLYSV